MEFEPSNSEPSDCEPSDSKPLELKLLYSQREKCMNFISDRSIVLGTL